MELPEPPEGWKLKSLIEINERSWAAHLWAPEAYVYGYGSNARYAMLDALQRIEDCNFFERLSGGKAFVPKLDIDEVLKKALG